MESSDHGPTATGLYPADVPPADPPLAAGSDNRHRPGRG